MSISHKRLLERLHYNPKTGQFTFKTHRCSCFVGKPAGSLMNTGYIEIQVDGLRFLAHRLAWFYMKKRWPKDKLDHRDGDRTNNIFSNIREATQAQNTCNKLIQSNNRSGVIGVAPNFGKKKKWRAYVNKNGKHYHLGNFDNIEDAAEARRKGSIKVHGEFAPELRECL